MLHTLTLLLPALIPSWRFFDRIAPSPRIEFTLLNSPDDTPTTWQEFRPRPAYFPFSHMLKRLFWNPVWNESLFLVSCAERLMANPTEHSIQQIQTRILAELKRHKVDITQTPYLQFRLVFINRQGTELHQHITFTSPIYDSTERQVHAAR